MDSFEEWVKNADHPCCQDWGEQAVNLGASWDSFNAEDSKPGDVVNALVSGGVPILAARDITKLAFAEVRKSKAPMAVFWDLENMPIPTETSGRDIIASLKSILSPHGNLKQLRGYASIGLNNIPEEKRSELHLSGCHLVDCPHHGRKEVADKMIIVDAMHFVSQYSEGATLCFITKDVDYAYLLATLQSHNCRTIVISGGTMQSMLHVNCDMKIRWETDVIQPIYRTFHRADEDKGDITSDNGSWATVAATGVPFLPLTADEEWNDDVELLRTVIKEQSQKCGSSAPRKSLIGNVLRATNPARFPERVLIQEFLTRAIAKGVVNENGTGPLKSLSLPDHSLNASPSIQLSDKLPRSLQTIPPKCLEVMNHSPYTVIVRKMHASGKTPAERAFVVSDAEWLFYFFSKCSYAVKAVADNDWMHFGTLVDSRHHFPFIPCNTNSVRSSSIAQHHAQCSVCQIQFPVDNTFMGGKGMMCSPDCQQWFDQDPAHKARGVSLVMETLEFLASYDDIYTSAGMLRATIHQRHPEECSSRKQAKLWMLEAARRSEIVVYKHLMTKQKHVATKSRFNTTTSQFQIGEVDTNEEEQFVYNYLFDFEGDGVDRLEINRMLAERFERMRASPHLRNLVFVNGRDKQIFFIFKGEHAQMVALTMERAEKALADASSAPRETQSREMLPYSASVGALGNFENDDRLEDKHRDSNSSSQGSIESDSSGEDLAAIVNRAR